ncbi:hypothetical protein [Streptomyces sp. NPDC051135]|uniref:hypothetical protein n=1 Tax=unclassified Streptomyces TaxID=2593676 RepID=UPI00342906B3
MTTQSIDSRVAPDRDLCLATLRVLPREATYVQETPGMTLFWEELAIEPPHPAERCPRGRNEHYVACYAEMITPEVRSTLECTLMPAHDGAHAAEIGFSEDGVCDQDMWMSWQAGVPGARQIHQPGECRWALGELGTNPCVLFKDHPGLHRGQGIGFVDDEGLNRHGERPYDDTHSTQRF